ncbi:MAG: right-handed parallel beta-helix repeat-containing protein, partial [Thermodesulfobacteriota bacterium]
MKYTRRGTIRKQMFCIGIRRLLVVLTIMIAVALGVTTEAWAYEIYDDATGGDCTLIGTWDDTTKTCTLNTDVYETIQIQGSNITLDGADYTLSGLNSGNGIVIPSSVQGVTIKNLTLTGWGAVGSNDAAINISGSYPSSLGNHTVQNNTITGSSRGIWLIYTNGNTLSGNTITGSYYYGIHGVFTTNDNTISGNVISSTTNGSGITIGSSGNTLSGNTANSNSNNGMNISGSNTLTGNTANGNGERGISVGGSGHILSGNTASSNGHAGIRLNDSSFNTLSGNTASFNGWGGITLWSD